MRGPSAEKKIKRAPSAQKFKLSPQSRLPAALLAYCFARCRNPRFCRYASGGEFQAGGDNRLGRHIFPYFRGKKSRRRGRKRAVRSGGNAPPYRNFARLRRRPNHSKIRFITAATAAKNGRERAIALFNCLTKFSIRKLDIFKNRFHKY